jgi:hypothetical protein
MIPALLTRMCSGPVQGLDERRHRTQVAEVEQADAHQGITGLRGDLRGNLGAGAAAPDREHDLGTGAGQRTRGLDSDPGRCARDQRPFSGETDSGDHVIGG